MGRSTKMVLFRNVSRGYKNCEKFGRELVFRLSDTRGVENAVCVSENDFFLFVCLFLCTSLKPFEMK